MLKIITEDNKIVQDYIKGIESKVNNNPVLKRYMTFEYTELMQSKDKVNYNITFKTIFPNIFFIYVACYLILIGLISLFIFNSATTLYFLLFFAIILFIPIIMQTNLFLYLLMKKVLRKKGYRGTLIWE